MVAPAVESDMVTVWMVEYVPAAGPITGVATWVAGGPAVPGGGADAISKDNVVLAESTVESMTVTEIEYCPDWVGVPETAPVEVLAVSPEGSPVTNHA